MLIAPVLLVVLQPDLGTALLIAAGGLTVAWLAGVRAKFFSCVDNIYYIITSSYFIFKTHQKSRILTFLNPEKDPLGAGYQITNLKLLLGSRLFERLLNFHKVIWIICLKTH